MNTPQKNARDFGPATLLTAETAEYETWLAEDEISDFARWLDESLRQLELRFADFVTDRTLVKCR